MKHVCVLELELMENGVQRPVLEDAGMYVRMQMCIGRCMDIIRCLHRYVHRHINDMSKGM